MTLNLKTLNRRGLFAAIFLALVGLAILIWFRVTKEEWGPELTTDPAYRSGRASLCKAPVAVGQMWPSEVQDIGLRSVDRGFERGHVYAFDATQFSGGVIDVCSEYGFIKLEGTSGTQGRVEVMVSNPFPEGERAIDDTRVTAELRTIDGRLQIVVAQLTQGVTSFRSFLAKGSRAAMVNVVIQVPRTGGYELNLTANHQRITIKNLDVRGLLEGYASPGADIDAGLDGPLTVRLNGVSYQAGWSGAAGLEGGTTAKLQPLRSSSVEFKADEGDVQLEMVGDAGLDITTNGAVNQIQIGPTDVSLVQSGTAYSRSAGFERAAIQVRVGASSAKGSVSVKRSAR